MWVRERQTQATFVLVVAFFVGLVTGTAAALLKWTIGGLAELLTSRFSHRGPDLWYILLAVFGIVATGAFTRYILKYRVQHGVEDLLRRIREKKPDMPPRLMFGSMIASTLTLGFGGSAGAEGPIAYTGAAIGSNLARKLGMSPQMVMTLMCCGAGAGIAGIFKSPIGGALFTIEVLRIELSTLSLLALILASLISGVTAYVLGGFQFDIHWDSFIPFDPAVMPWIILLAVFCGFYSYYYAAVMKWLRGRFDSIKNPWVVNLVSGLILGLLLVLFPALYGEGYDVISKLLSGENLAMFDGSIWVDDLGSVHALMWLTAGALMMKCWAACATNSGGGVAGDFAPTLFAGALAGLLFATFVNTFFGTALPTPIFALAGMSAVMSGAIRAPFMAIFLTMEMTASYGYILPIIVAGAISFGVVKALTPGSFYPLRRLDSN